jgi:hypothetical protein
MLRREIARRPEDRSRLECFRTLAPCTATTRVLSTESLKEMYLKTGREWDSGSPGTKWCALESSKV